MATSVARHAAPPAPMTPGIKRTPSLSPSVVSSFSSLYHQREEPSIEDYERAVNLMTQQRSAAGNQRSSDFGQKDANPVLAKLARGQVPDATPGLVQALLDWGADVSIAKSKSSNFFKVLSGKDQIEERSDVLQHAVRNCSSDVLIVLAQGADEQAINQALPAALDLADPVKTSILLAKGANATPHCDLFLKCVESASVDMVVLLLREVKGACRECKNKGLVRAAKVGSAEKANLLMDRGADVLFDGASALFEAIRQGNEQVALEILSRPAMKKNTAILNSAAQCAGDHGQQGIRQACLDATSAGPGSKHKRMPDRNLIFVNGSIVQSPPAASNAETALLSAVTAGRLDTVQQLLSDTRSGGLPPDVLASALGQSALLPELTMAYKMVDVLLSANPRGDAVADCLCGVVGRSIPPASENDRLQIIHLLLKKGRADVNARKGSPVLQSIGPGRTDILRMMLQHGPSPDTMVLAIDAAMKIDTPPARLATLKVLVEGGNVAKSEFLQDAAVSAASRSLALDVLEYIGGFVKSPAIFSGGVGALTKQGDSWLSPKKFYVVQYLLNRGASGPNIDAALARAAGLYNRDAVQLLATGVESSSLDYILGVVIGKSSDWQLPENLWLVHSLLEWGCKGASVNQALIQAVSAHVEGRNLELLIDTLLLVGMGADVNDQHGKALQVAARRGHTSLLKKLASNGAGRLALTHAFQTIVTSKMDEATALTLLDILVAACEQSRTRFDVESMLPDGRYPLHACLSTHPKAARLAKRLIQLGCKASIPIRTKLDGREEWVPLLVWVLYQNERQPVEFAALAALIDAHRDAINFRSASGMTPLIAAVQFGLNDLVGEILKAGAKPSERDNMGQTALFFASGRGNMVAAQALLKAKAAPNDGSLHEAARNMYNEVVEVLIKARHETNFPSSLHEGRTALQELCYRARCESIFPELEDTIRALEKGKADPFALYRGRNSLFLALENPQPYYITKAFLDIQMWRYINHDNNVFIYTDERSSTKLVYSPTMYFRHNCFQGNAGHAKHLISLLTEKACDDRFFARFEPHQLEEVQPPGAVGVPKPLADEDARRRVEQERRRVRERDHAEKLRREQEEAAHKARIEGSQHQLRLERQKQTSMLQAAMAAQQAEVRNARRQR